MLVASYGYESSGAIKPFRAVSETRPGSSVKRGVY